VNHGIERTEPEIENRNMGNLEMRMGGVAIMEDDK
jgi:hypothetical protein